MSDACVVNLVNRLLYEVCQIKRSGGTTGPTGPNGPPGAPGSQGPTGADGPTGCSFLTVSSPPTDLTESCNTYLDTTNGELYSWCNTPYANEPQIRSIPTYSGSNRSVTTEAQLVAAVAGASQGDIVTLADNITLSTTLIVDQGIKLTAIAPTVKLSALSSQTITVNVTVDNVLIQGITIENTNTSTVATAVSFSSATATNNYVDSSVAINTNEFGIASNNIQIQITNCSFCFVGSPDSHRYINLQRTTGETIIDGNTFEGNGTNNTQFVYMASSGANFLNGKIMVSNNTSILSPVQRLMIVESDLTGANCDFFIINNTVTSTSGFVIFYNSNILAGVHSITAYGNVETYGGATPPGGKGIIGLDWAAAATLPDPNSLPYLYFCSNTAALLRSDYTDWSAAGDRGIAYSSVFSAPSGLKYYSPGVVGTLISTTSTASPITITATTTAPTVTSTTIEKIDYQTRSDMVFVKYRFGWTAGTAGSGDYLFALPTGLTFNTASGYNPIYTGTLWSPTIQSSAEYLIPANGGAYSASGDFSSQMFIVPYSATQFRVVLDSSTTSLTPMGSTWYGFSQDGMINMSFEMWSG